MDHRCSYAYIKSSTTVILIIDSTKMVVNLAEVTGKEAILTNEYKDSLQEADIPGTSLVISYGQVHCFFHY